MRVLVYGWTQHRPKLAGYYWICDEHRVDDDHYIGELLPDGSWRVFSQGRSGNGGVGVGSWFWGPLRVPPKGG